MQKINLVMSNKIYNIAFMENKELEEAIKVLQKHLSEDKSEGSYYHSWVCNIAMAFKDVANPKIEDAHISEYEITKEDIHEIANQAAINFLDLLIKE